MKKWTLDLAREFLADNAVVSEALDKIARQRDIASDLQREFAKKWADTMAEMGLDGTSAVIIAQAVVEAFDEKENSGGV